MGKLNFIVCIYDDDKIEIIIMNNVINLENIEHKELYTIMHIKNIINKILGLK